MRLNARTRLVRFARRHDLVLVVVALVVVAMVPVVLELRSRPTAESAARHFTAEALAGIRPKLSDAEIRALEEGQHVPERAWVTEERSKGTAVRRLDAPGEVTFDVGYSDGYIDVSDVRHLVTAEDEDPIAVASRTHAVVVGGPGEAMISACCEHNLAPVTLALLRRAPRGIPAWPEVSEVDLDLGTGQVAFTSTGGMAALVSVPRGRYRMRVSGRGAVEYERERFRVELWPRTQSSGLEVRRVAPKYRDSPEAPEAS
jgi:hypothetical protein